MANSFSSTLSQLIQLVRQPAPASTHQAYPKLRNFILDVMAEGRRKNIINLLFEVELAPVRDNLARHSAATSERISLTTYLAKSLACAVAENKPMHGYRHGKSKLILFEDVDLSVMVEREIEEGALPVALLPVTHIVRSANNKTSGEIHKELQAAKVAPLGEQGPMSALEKRFFEMPAVLRKIVWFFIRRDPAMFKDLVGTVGVTSMGMHTSGSAVVIPITPMTLTLSIGSIGKKLVLENGVPVERDIIHLNLGADHDIIDGAPLMRFADRFKIMLAEGYALDCPQPSIKAPSTAPFSAAEADSDSPLSVPA
ncbi:2-oxoacid dehydrogenases acyltransferase (catalytic domain) [Collimonas sp. OK307]|uniref:2-oxo acid dehydrogenase subunit E2 n=1 Tax=Collimonas sp. OK307 TaxID=1801620 RepID=UPI0008E33409|nr:2-oxo acid dehydrogenase subunit E2 [Collimonas sp. OK307]SFI17711.1 2-oxoacid dehydrogenases acyltransferase (catalytic domain) [Collimonas sp. OK307]